MSSARHAASLRTWNGLNEVCHDLLCSMWCNEMFYVTAAPVLQPRIRRWWHRGKVPGRKGVGHECSWLWMQLWKTRAIYLDTECTPVKSRHSRSFFIFPKVASTMVMTLPVHSFPKYVNCTQCDWVWALCKLRQAIPDHCAFQCHLLGMSLHIESTMPAAKTADKKACAQTLYANMLNSIADFRESQLIPRGVLAVFHQLANIFQLAW